MIKKCSRCNIEKDISNFKKRSDRVNSFNSWCIACKQEYDRLKIKEKLHNNIEFKAEHKSRAIRDLSNRRNVIINYLKSNPCMHCGENDIELLEFDHRERNEKEYNVSKMYSSIKSEKAILAEIAKCDVLCGNCHRHKTMHESNSWRAKYCQKESCSYN